MSAVKTAAAKTASARVAKKKAQAPAPKPSVTKSAAVRKPAGKSVASTSSPKPRTTAKARNAAKAKGARDAGRAALDRGASKAPPAKGARGKAASRATSGNAKSGSAASGKTAANRAKSVKDKARTAVKKASARTSHAAAQGARPVKPSAAKLTKTALTKTDKVKAGATVKPVAKAKPETAAKKGSPKGVTHRPVAASEAAPKAVATSASKTPAAQARRSLQAAADSISPAAVEPRAAAAPASTIATRKAAAAFVAARQKMAVPASPVPSENKSIDAAKGVVEVANSKVRKTVGEQDAGKTAASVKIETPAPVAVPPRPAMPMRPGMPGGPQARIAKPAPVKGQTFKTNEFIVYPSHGVGQIVAIEQQEVAGYKLELFVISFVKDKMILKVPLPKIASVGMRKLAEAPVVKRALDTLTGRARIKRTMWSRRAQEYEAKINSGDLIAIAEVVRDLYRSDAQPEQSYSERQLYEAALDRMARELAAVQKVTDAEALKLIDGQLQKGPRRGKAEEPADEGDETEDDGGIDEAA